jgi:hypothetical protein
MMLRRRAAEVAKRGWERGVDKHNITTTNDIGLRRDQIHEARQLRDIDFNDPGFGLPSAERSQYHF